MTIEQIAAMITIAQQVKDRMSAKKFILMIANKTGIRVNIVYMEALDCGIIEQYEEPKPMFAWVK